MSFTVLKHKIVLSRVYCLIFCQALWLCIEATCVFYSRIVIIMLMMVDIRLATRVRGTIGVFGRSTSVVVTCARLRIQEDGRCLLWLLLNEELSKWSSENILAAVFLHFCEVSFEILLQLFTYNNFWNVACWMLYEGIEAPSFTLITLYYFDFCCMDYIFVNKE